MVSVSGTLVKKELMTKENIYRAFHVWLFHRIDKLKCFLRLYRYFLSYELQQPS